MALSPLIRQSKSQKPKTKTTIWDSHSWESTYCEKFSDKKIRSNLCILQCHSDRIALRWCDFRQNYTKMKTHHPNTILTLIDDIHQLHTKDDQYKDLTKILIWYNVILSSYPSFKKLSV